MMPANQRGKWNWLRGRRLKSIGKYIRLDEGKRIYLSYAFHFFFILQKTLQNVDISKKQNGTKQWDYIRERSLMYFLVIKHQSRKNVSGN